MKFEKNLQMIYTIETGKKTIYCGIWRKNYLLSCEGEVDVRATMHMYVTHKQAQSSDQTHADQSINHQKDGDTH